MSDRLDEARAALEAVRAQGGPRASGPSLFDVSPNVSGDTLGRGRVAKIAPADILQEVAGSLGSDPTQELAEGRTLMSGGTRVAEIERDTAIAAVALTWSGEATQALDALLERIARERATFTADDLHDALQADLTGVDMRLLGSVLTRAAKRGVIRAGGYQPSRRRHASPIRQWISLTYQDDAR